jgi:PAS domain S-box-containing protein
MPYQAMSAFWPPAMRGAPVPDGSLMLSVFMTHSPTLAWVKDGQGCYRFVNARMLRRFELDADDILGKTDFEVFPESAAALLRAHDQQVIATGIPLEAVEQVPGANGGPPASWFVTKFSLPDCPPGYVGGIAFEITALQRAEQERVEVEDAHRQILDAMPDMVLVKGLGSRLEWANKAFRETYGLSNEQLRGLIDASFVEPDLTQQYVRDDLRVFESGLPLDIPEEPVRRFDGVTVMVHTVKSPVFDLDGKVIKTVGVSRDITDRKRLETELRQAQKLESIGRMASGVAHEINTPIQFVGDQAAFIDSTVGELLALCETYRAVIASARANDDRLTAEDYARVTLQEEATELEYAAENLPKAFTSIKDGVSRVAKLVRAMKQFGHPDPIELRPADINEALQSTLTIAANEIKYIATVETDFGVLPPVWCQIGELNQVFLNLLINAAHAVSDVVKVTGGCGTIKVTSRHEGPNVVVSISDTGGGIPAEIRDKIFEPFFTTKEVGRGTGQGLAIARVVVVEKHGGTLAFDSEPGVGTTFRITLPTRRAI